MGICYNRAYWFQLCLILFVHLVFLICSLAFNCVTKKSAPRLLFYLPCAMMPHVASSPEVFRVINVLNILRLLSCPQLYSVNYNQRGREGSLMAAVNFVRLLNELAGILILSLLCFILSLNSFVLVCFKNLFEVNCLAIGLLHG